MIISQAGIPTAERPSSCLAGDGREASDAAAVAGAQALGHGHRRRQMRAAGRTARSASTPATRRTTCPRFPTRAHDVRWIWKEPLERAFPAQVDDTPRCARRRRWCCATTATIRRACGSAPPQATLKREDGIVAMDWHRCIGCRYCMAACPYGSRSFNWIGPAAVHQAIPIPSFRRAPRASWRSARSAPSGWPRASLPACVEVCPAKALVFGNLADPESPIRQLLASRQHIRRKPELGTGPSVYYIV